MTALNKKQQKLSQGGAEAFFARRDRKEYKDENELREAIFDARDVAGQDAGTGVVNAKKRTSLLEKLGFTFVDVRELTPNEMNSYTIDEESIEGLAKLIVETKNTDPLLVMETDEGLKIIDGERRYRAHLLLGKTMGETYYMVPARVYKQGTLSDDEVKFILHAENIGQRTMKPSERAEGFAVVFDRVSKTKQGVREGEKTREALARQFGCSPRLVTDEVSIGRNLIEEGKDKLDDGVINKQLALALSKISEDEQRSLLEKLETGLLSNEEVVNEAKEIKEEQTAEKRGERKRTQRKKKGVDDEIKTAASAFRRALKYKQRPDRVTLAKMKDLLEEMQAMMKQLEELENLPPDEEKVDKEA